MSELEALNCGFFKKDKNLKSLTSLLFEELSGLRNSLLDVTKHSIGFLQEVRMNSNDIRQLKPFLSLLIVIGTLMGLVFIKMEERRLSYVVLKLTREFKRSNEISRQKEISLAKLTRPQLVANVATQKLTLRKIKPGQIINLTTMPIVAENNLSFKSRVHP